MDHNQLLLKIRVVVCLIVENFHKIIRRDLMLLIQIIKTY